MPVLRSETPLIRLILMAAVIFLLGVSIFAILRYGDYFMLNSDDAKYIKSSLVLLESGKLTYKYDTQSTVYIMPGLPLLLAGFVKLFGMNVDRAVVGFRIFQAFLQAGSVVFIFLIGRKVFGSTVGVLACVFDVFYVPEIATSGLVLTETVFKFLVLGLIYVTLNAAQTRKRSLYAAAGVFLGLSCLFRPVIVLYPMVALILLMKQHYPFGEILKRGLIVLTVFCCILSPWWIRNGLVFHRFIPLTLSNGNPFLAGTYINYDQTNKNTYLPKNVKKDLLVINEIEMTMGKNRLITLLRQQPLQCVYWYTIGKTCYMWNKPFYCKKVFRIPENAVSIYHFAILFLAVIGILGSIRHSIGDAMFLSLVILYFNVVYLPFFTMPRYAYPVIPIVMVFAAYGVVMIWLWIKSISKMARVKLAQNGASG